MTYSYSAPIAYPQGENIVMYDGMSKQKSSSIPATAIGTLAGATIGGVIGYKKNPFISKDGVVSDTFAKNAYANYAKKAEEVLQKTHEQSLDAIKKLEKFKDPDDLIRYINNKKEAFNEIIKDIDLKNITTENLSENIKTMKERITAKLNNNYQNMKNNIQTCWDKTQKKFVKQDHIDEKIFDAIKKSTKGIKTTQFLKYSAIAGLIGGICGFAAHKILSAKNNIPQQ